MLVLGAIVVRIVMIDCAKRGPASARIAGSWFRKVTVVFSG